MLMNVAKGPRPVVFVDLEERQSSTVLSVCFMCGSASQQGQHVACIICIPQLLLRALKAFERQCCFVPLM